MGMVWLAWRGVDSTLNGIGWDVRSELSEVPVMVDRVGLTDWEFGVSIPAQVVVEQFVAAERPITAAGVWVELLLMGLGLLIVLAAITVLPRFWYIGSMVVFLLLLAAVRTETLLVGGDSGRFFYLFSALLFGGLSYWLHAFRPDARFPLRLFYMGGAMVLWALVVGLGSMHVAPVLVLASYGIPLWLVLTVLFVLVSATEIIAALVWLSTNGRTSGRGSSSLIPFLTISLLYFLNLILVYLVNTRRVSWDTFLVHPLWLLVVAGVLGLWGFRARSESMASVMPFRESGFWWYSGLFMCALGFTSYSYGTFNDPLWEVVEDAVVYGQLGMGVLFLFYCLANFFPLFRQGLPVYKVLYKPLKFSLAQARIFGFAAFVGLVSMQGLLPVYQATSGYFNALGDVHMSTEEYALAEQYYKMGLQQEFQNHKSNYALARLASIQGDAASAAYYYKQATLKKPTPQAYAGLAEVLAQERLFFDAMFSLQEGIRTFPNQGELLTNLGVLHAQTNVLDSAYYYFEKAEKLSRRPEVPATNQLAILLRTSDQSLLESLPTPATTYTSRSWEANFLALQTLQKKQTELKRQPLARADSLLSVGEFAYLYNYTLNQLSRDTTAIQLFPRLAERNPLLGDDLLLLSIYADFYGGDKIRALGTMTALAEENTKKAPFYQKILGHWWLQTRLYDKAIAVFSGVPDTEARLGEVVSQALRGEGGVAAVLLDKLDTDSSTVTLLRQSLERGWSRRATRLDTLLIEAEKPDVREEAIQELLRENPLDERAVLWAVLFYEKQKQMSQAYQLLVRALPLNDQSAALWQAYAWLSVRQGLLQQADEAADRAARLAFPNDTTYQAFLVRYQEERTLVEKSRRDFE
jgi:tetratricopeptide (TPR) repeat protein